MRKLKFLLAAALLFTAGYLTSAEIGDLDITDASNTARWAEGQAPSTVNDGARALEGLLARWYWDTNASLVSTSTSNAFSVSASETLAAGYYDGLIIAFEADAAITSSATLAVDSHEAFEIMKANDTSLASGDIEAGQKVVVIFDASAQQWELVTHIANAPATGDMLAANNLSDVSDADVSLHNLGLTPTSGKVTSGWLDEEVDPIDRQTIHIPAAGCISTNSNGADSLAKVETTSGRGDFNHVAFDPTSDEHCQFSFSFPRGWNSAVSLFYRVWWTQSTSAAGGVAWFLQGAAITDNATLDVAFSVAQVLTDTSHATSEDAQVSGVSFDGFTPSGSPSQHDYIVFRLGRDVSDSDDTMLDDAQFLGLDIYFDLIKASDEEG